MSWLLLVLGVLSLGFVANAFVPVRRNVWLFLPSFMASWLAIELAWLNLRRRSGAHRPPGVGRRPRPLGRVGRAGPVGR